MRVVREPFAIGVTVPARSYQVAAGQPAPVQARTPVDFVNEYELPETEALVTTYSFGPLLLMAAPSTAPVVQVV